MWALVLEKEGLKATKFYTNKKTAESRIGTRGWELVEVAETSLIAHATAELKSPRFFVCTKEIEIPVHDVSVANSLVQEMAFMHGEAWIRPAD